MNPQPITHGTEPGRANNPPGLAHAFVQNGAIHLLRWGRVERVTRSEAVSALSQVEGSPFPSSQERARQIRAALQQPQKETSNGHAH